MKMIIQTLRRLFENVIIVTIKSPRNKLIFVEPKTMQPKRRKKMKKLQNSRLQAKLPMLPE